jgi:hypothetical protein
VSELFRNAAGITEHPSECNAECEDGYRDRCGTREHPSRCAAERATTVSPRGEMNVTRSALHSEGCSAMPPQIVNSTSLSKRCSAMPSRSLYLTPTSINQLIIQPITNE